MEDAVHAMIMAFSMLVFVIGLSIVMYMFQQVTSTSESILYYSDETNYYDNIEIEEGQTTRQVDIDTMIISLYRYYKENFCVKIYDAPTSGNDKNLLHIFDVNLEGNVRKAAALTNSNATPEQNALKQIYNKKDSPLYLFEAPWIGSTDENMKTRVDYYINGDAGYINNTYVDYKDNKFYKIRKHNQTASEADKVYFKEEFVRYTYTGDTMVNDEGEILVEGAQPKDKIVIIYTATKYIN